MTEHLARLAIELDEKATKGPWQTRFMFRLFQRVRESPGDLAFNTKPDADWDDCAFIAFARTALPTLAKDWLRLAEENERLKVDLAKLNDGFNSECLRADNAEVAVHDMRARAWRAEALADDLSEHVRTLIENIESGSYESTGQAVTEAQQFLTAQSLRSGQ